MDSAILRYTQLAYLACIQYSDGLYAKSCKVPEVYNKLTLNNIIIEEVDSFISQTARVLGHASASEREQYYFQAAVAANNSKWSRRRGIIRQSRRGVEILHSVLLEYFVSERCWRKAIVFFDEQHLS